MTKEQQNILALFNTKDSVNMEIAEETAISTGNGVWFSNWIDEKLKEEGIEQLFHWTFYSKPDFETYIKYRIFDTFIIPIPSGQNVNFLKLLNLLDIKLKAIY